MPQTVELTVGTLRSAWVHLTDVATTKAAQKLERGVDIDRIGGRVGNAGMGRISRAKATLADVPRNSYHIDVLGQMQDAGAFPLLEPLVRSRLSVRR